MFHVPSTCCLLVHPFHALLGLFGKFGGVLCMDHVIFDPCHPYIRASTDAVISLSHWVEDKPLQINYNYLYGVWATSKHIQVLICCLACIPTELF